MKKYIFIIIVFTSSCTTWIAFDKNVCRVVSTIGIFTEAVSYIDRSGKVSFEFGYNGDKVIFISEPTVLLYMKNGSQKAFDRYEKYNVWYELRPSSDIQLRTFIDFSWINLRTHISRSDMSNAEYARISIRYCLAQNMQRSTVSNYSNWYTIDVRNMEPIDEDEGRAAGSAHISRNTFEERH